MADDEPVPLMFDVAGPEDAPAVILLHGFPFTRAVWSPVMTALSTHYRVIAPDLRGHGASPPGDGPAGVERMAQDVLALADKLGIESFALAGHSMGGYVAFQVARLAPARLNALVLVTTRASPDSDAAKAGRRKQSDMVQLDGLGALANLLVPKLVAGASAGIAREEARRMIESNQVTGIVNALEGMAERPDATPLLLDIKAPTLVVAGGSDELMPLSEQDTLAREIPNARKEIIGNAGHLPMMEQPEKFTSVVTAFLDEALRAS